MADDDLDAQFALFQRQIQSVTAKRQKHENGSAESQPAKTNLPVVQSESAKPVRLLATTSNAPAANTSATLKKPTNTAAAQAPEAQTSGPNLSSRQASSAAPQTGGWRWNGEAWKWHDASATKTSAKLKQAAPVAKAPSTAQSPPKAKSSQSYEAPALYPQKTFPTSARLAVGPSNPSVTNETQKPSVPVKRSAAGDVWEDRSLTRFPENDHRIFVGDLGPDASEVELETAFSRYPSFNMVRIVRDKRTGLCRGYGFVSFAAGEDMIKALKEMNGKYVGSRPLKLKKSTWQKRTLTTERRKELHEFGALTGKKRSKHNA